MTRNIAWFLAAIAIAGCAAEQVVLGKLPPIANPADAGEVVLIRARAFIGEDMSYYVNVDQTDIFELRQGEHTRFQLPAGEHRIAIRCFGALSGWSDAAITQRVVAGQTTYFAVAPKYGCASLDPVPESEAGKLLARTRFRPLH
jgi:hypothetical protein